MSRPLQTELHTALDAVVADLDRTATEMVATLEAERAALLGADAALLDRIGERKQQLAQQLEQLDAERVQLARLAPAADAQRDATWQRVLDTLKTCRDLNQRNGSLVNQRLVQVRQALAVLTGQGGEGNGVYGPGGELRTALRSQRLASA